MSELDELQKSVGEWGMGVFTRSTLGTITTHLRREADELAAKPADPSEAAGILLLLLQVAHRCGYSLMDAARATFEEVKGREWGEPDAEGVAEHVRGPLDERQDFEARCLVDPNFNLFRRLSRECEGARALDVLDAICMLLFGLAKGQGPGGDTAPAWAVEQVKAMASTPPYGPAELLYRLSALVGVLSGAGAAAGSGEVSGGTGEQGDGDGAHH